MSLAGWGARGGVYAAVMDDAASRAGEHPAGFGSRAVLAAAHAGMLVERGASRDRAVSDAAAAWTVSGTEDTRDLFSLWHELSS